jgi:2'-5' RNA ligase
VIFLNVNSKADMGQQAAVLLKALQDIDLPLKTEDRPFHPHVTIAFKDLKRQYFEDAYSYFKGIQFSHHFTARDCTLLKREEGRWNAIRSIRFVVA